MSRKPGPGGQKRRSPNKRNSPLRPKVRVRSLETAINAAGEASQEGQFTEVNADSIPENERENSVSKKDVKQKGIRLQKLLADRGYGSRRKMETWIREAKIEVNGQTAQIGQRVTSRDTVRVNGYALREKAKLSGIRVLMYNKPEGEICTMKDPRRRPTVFHGLPKIRGARWVTVGRLDINTSGLLLFTTNGELANKLTHPPSGIEREYRCRVFGNVDKSIIQLLIDGGQIDKHQLKFNKVVVHDQEGDQRNKWVHVMLEEGRNREVRKLWEAVGCQISRLTRVRYGFLSLPRNLRQGQFRELSSKEVSKLLDN